MSRTLTWFVLILFLSVGWLFSQTSQSGDPTTSSNKQAPDTPSSAETTKQDVGVLQGIAEATANSAKDRAWFQETGNALLLWDYLTAKTFSEENRAGFEFGTTISQQLFLENPPWVSLVVAVADRAGLLQKTEIEKMEDNAYLNGSITPEPVLTLNSSNGIVIDNQLVSDSPAPASGITIETQVIPNPSNVGIEVKAPVTPISIESSLSPDSPARPEGNSAKGGGAHIDWAGVISNSLQILDAGVRAYDAFHTPAISAPPSPARAPSPASTNTLKRATMAPAQQTSHNTSPPPGTPGRGNSHPTPTPVPVSTPPPQNCSGGICCTPPSVPNPAAVACLNSPTPGCDHPNGPESWLQFCISR